MPSCPSFQGVATLPAKRTVLSGVSKLGGLAQELVRSASTASGQSTFLRDRVSVVIPTYCEAENLRVLIPRLASVLRNADIDAELLIVDDGSSDGTNEVCLELARRFPVRLMVRKSKRGLASAVIDGMHASQFEIVVVMDADLSHPAERVPELVECISSGRTDFALGSRYIPGGTLDQKWSIWRWLNSRTATLLARPLTAIHDPMSGFFAINARLFCEPMG
ncbi:MAG: glycosyltransferase [Pirellulaceae bacterium]